MTLKKITNPLLHIAVNHNTVTITEDKNIDNSDAFRKVSIVGMPRHEEQFAYTRDVQINNTLLYNEFLNVPSPNWKTPVNPSNPREGDYWKTTQIKCEEYPNLNDRADAVVLSQNNQGEITAIICDLKSQHSELEKCVIKFNLDKLHLDYIVNLANISDTSKNLKITHCVYIIFMRQKINKAAMRAQKRTEETASTSGLTIKKIKYAKDTATEDWENLIMAKPKCVNNIA